ncbi:amino acid adenylation domain-containing protein [Pseudoalteromonas sp. SCSIO 43201]|uniref:non-ribosomal peptide synthetase n=1 Tax=Pseudoalteromonas sp. SCSIO 43201 TaxID=2822842 RepID=UPI00207524AD|nr:non-ribosomal peptide synthetase [Pseudoalteromonas sp. SCSIO 43201]USD27189.1 amino acid adenylation domain-containing protein [Pseudoalteromonas sp. SCSIO 43201]
MEQLIEKCRTLGISFSLSADEQLELHAKTQPSAALIDEIKAEKQNLISLIKRNKLKQLIQQLAQPISSNHAVKQAEVSFQQQRMWLADSLREGATEYHLTKIFALKGALNQVAFEQALRQVIDCNSALTTQYEKTENTIVQRQAPASADVYRLHLCTKLSEEAIFSAIQQRVETPFDLRHQSPIRVEVFQKAPHAYYFVFVIHHIAADGWSIALFCQQVAKRYEQLIDGTAYKPQPESISYIDYARWQRAILTPKQLDLLSQWWQKKLEGCATNVTFPCDNSRPLHSDLRAHFYTSSIKRSQLSSIKAFAKAHACTPFTVVYSVFNVLLAFYSNESDIVIGTPVANRDHAQLQTLIGFIANTVVMRQHIDFNKCFAELLEEAKLQTTDAFEHAHLPFEVLLEKLPITRHHNQPPLFNVFLAMHNMKPIVPTLKNIEITPTKTQFRKAKFDLTLDIFEQPDSLLLEWEYACDLYHHQTIKRLAENFSNVLDTLLQNATQPMSAITLIAPQQQATLQQAWQGVQRDYSHRDILPFALQQSFARHKDKIAIVDQSGAYSYQMLQALVKQYSALIQTQSLEANCFIGVYCHRSVHMVAAMLAILHSGHAYLPLDPNYPTARIAHMVDDSDTQLILCDPVLLEHCQSFDVTVQCLQANFDVNTEKNLPAVGITANSLAYIIYTSGSTGKPKGVTISHFALRNFLYAMQETFALDEHTSALAITSISFDIHVLELYLPLLVGGTVHLATNAQSKDPQQLQSLINRAGVNFIQATPSSLNMLKSFNVQLHENTTVLSGGEALPLELKQYLNIQAVALWNMYGPTETTVWSSVASLGHDDDIHLGKPIANTQFYVVNQQLQLVPRGVTGELLIAGDGLANGYLNQAQQTSDKFISFAHDQGHISAYKTGDLVKIDSCDRLIYQGRIDQQIKLNGFRIEISEIENTISQYPDIDAAAIVLSQTEKLSAFIVLKPNTEINLVALRQYIAERLPYFMQPAEITTLPQLPLTPNGKTDKLALTKQSKYENHEQTTQGTIQHYPKVLVQLWQRKLNVDVFDPFKSFFELGGNSIQVIDLIASINHTLGISITIKAFIQNPCLDHMADLVEQTQSEHLVTLDLRLDEHHYQDEEIIPLPSLPNRQYLLAMGGEHHLWVVNHSMALVDEDNRLTFDLLNRAITLLISHHPAFRTRFDVKKSNEYIESVKVTLSQKICFDLSHLALDQVAAFITKEVQTIRLTSSLLRLFYVKKGNSVFVTLSLHHLIFDGFSMEVLARHLERIITALKAGATTCQLQKDRYIDFANAYYDYFSQPFSSGKWHADIAFWQQAAKQQSDRLFPVEQVMKANQGDAQRHTVSTLPKGLSAQISASAKQLGISQSTIHTAALANALKTTFELNEVAIELSQFNRFNQYLGVSAEAIVGYLISPVNLLLESCAFESIHSTAVHIDTFLASAPHNATGYYALSHLNPDDKVKSALPVLQPADFSFNYQGELNTSSNPHTVTKLEDWHTKLKHTIPFVVSDETMSSPYSLYISTYFEQGQQHVFVGYSALLFNEQQITTLIEKYINNLKGM